MQEYRYKSFDFDILHNYKYLISFISQNRNEKIFITLLL